MEQIARNGAPDLLKATLPVQMQPFIFFRSSVVVMISALTESLLMITVCCCSGTKQACRLLFSIWRVFHGNIHGVKIFHANIDRHSKASQVTPWAQICLQFSQFAMHVQNNYFPTYQTGGNAEVCWKHTADRVIR